MNHEQQLAEQTQQLQRQYGVNVRSPEIHWDRLFQNSKLKAPHLQALNTLYQTAVPLALQVFEELNFECVSPCGASTTRFRSVQQTCSTGGSNYWTFWKQEAKAQDKAPASIFGVRYYVVVRYWSLKHG